MNSKDIRIISGRKATMIEAASALCYLWKAFLEYKSVRKGLEVMSQINNLKIIIAGHEINKLVKANGRYYWNMHLPGFPSRALTDHVFGEMHRIRPVQPMHNRLSVLFFGITKKCPLQCQHCYEWQALNQQDTMTLEDMRKIVLKFREAGVSHIQFGGGEPMTQFDDLVALVESIKTGPDIWISTNGFNLSADKAMRLRKAGLTGAAISVDHFEPELHNTFRGNPKAFDWVMSATENCRKAGLITCWSVCTTREFTSRDNLIQYALAAKRKQVTYIQLFEPMPAGRYAGQNVSLDQDQVRILEDFYVEMNTSPAYRDFPLVVWLGAYQRRIGCLGSGNRYVYVDTDGNIQSCPFCRTSKRMAVNDHPVEETLEWIMGEGCGSKRTLK